jgi:NAD(P)H-nitrite reductase large subunit
VSIGGNVIKHLILGNGIAAISAVKALRSVNADDEITIVSREKYCAYSPVLTTYYLGGSIGRDDVFICDESFYRQNKINLVLGINPVKLDIELRKVYLDNNETLNYDDLLIATGSSSIVPSIKGGNLPGVFTLYSVDDAEKIISFLQTMERVAVIGAGFIGMQTIGALTKRGKDVLIVEMADQILPQTLDYQGAKILEERLCQEGVDIYFSETASGLYDKGGGKVISLASGAELTADSVIIAVGVRPNVAFLRGSGLKLHKGVIVDQHCRTNADGVYAAGDAAEACDSITGYYTINATWPNAIEQGRVAGLNMAGKNASILTNTRFNVSTLFGFSCASIGLIRAEGTKLDEIVTRSGDNYRKLFFKEGLLVGAVLLGEIAEAGIIANLIQRRSLLPNLYDALSRCNVSNHPLDERYWSLLFRLDRL